MRRLFILFLVVSIAFASGLENLELGGYLENKTSLMFADDESFSDIATLRIEGGWEFGERGGVETHMILSGALQPLDPFEAFKSGSVMERAMMEVLIGPMIMLDTLLVKLDSLGLMDSTSKQLESENDFETYLKYLPYSSFYPRNKIILDRALLKLYFKYFDIYIGRQMIAWGTGYGFNPTDVWNKKSPLDPNAPKVGVNAMRMEIPFGSISGLSLVVSPGADFEHSSGGFRVKGNLGGYDFSLCGMRIMNADMELLGLPKKVIAGVDMAGQIGDVGVWSECVVVNPVYMNMDYTGFDSLYIQADLGLDYTFTNGLYTMLEYYYNGLGQYTSDNYSFRDFLNMFGGEMSGMGQNYLMFGITKDMFDHYILSLFALGNLNDQSVILLPSLEYSFHDNISLKLSSQIGLGDDKKTEYGGMHSSMILTVTGYF